MIAFPLRRIAVCALIPLLLAGCAAPLARQDAQDEAVLRREFADLFVPSGPMWPDTRKPRPFLSGRGPGLEECRQVLAAVREARAAGKEEFDGITRLEFDSATETSVGITWSGGFHGGVLRLEKKDGKWILTQGIYAF